MTSNSPVKSYRPIVVVKSGHSCKHKIICDVMYVVIYRAYQLQVVVLLLAIQW